MATNFLKLATTLKYLGAKWLPGKKVNFTPCYSDSWVVNNCNETSVWYDSVFFYLTVMDSSLPTSLKHIISNVEYYGPVLFMAGVCFIQIHSCVKAPSTSFQNGGQ